MEGRDYREAWENLGRDGYVCYLNYGNGITDTHVKTHQSICTVYCLSIIPK